MENPDVNDTLVKGVNGLPFLFGQHKTPHDNMILSMTREECVKCVDDMPLHFGKHKNMLGVNLPDGTRVPLTEFLLVRRENRLLDAALMIITSGNHRGYINTTDTLIELVSAFISLPCDHRDQVYAIFSFMNVAYRAMVYFGVLDSAPDYQDKISHIPKEVEFDCCDVFLRAQQYGETGFMHLLKDFAHVVGDIKEVPRWFQQWIHISLSRCIGEEDFHFYLNLTDQLPEDREKLMFKCGPYEETILHLAAQVEGADAGPMVEMFIEWLPDNAKTVCDKLGNSPLHDYRRSRNEPDVKKHIVELLSVAE